MVRCVVIGITNQDVIEHVFMMKYLSIYKKSSIQKTIHYYIGAVEDQCTICEVQGISRRSSTKRPCKIR